jgi:cellulose synthase/poly-beta-1,6-N-acetylglucosamine synthase-like glycosyltransferase
MIGATIIIAFYRKTHFLRLVLAGFARQSFQDFEILIADDGSDAAAVEEVRAIIASNPRHIRHIWHEDRGFRKNKILNSATATALSDYLIFADADCVPHRDFVRNHVENAQPKVCLAGRRVDLSERITEKLSEEKIRAGYLEKHLAQMLLDSLLLGSKNVEKGIYIKSKYLGGIINRKKRGLLGSNFSLHKADLLSINGFDERYEAPGIGEDRDIEFRLEQNNVHVKSLGNVAIQYHLYHQKLAIGEANARLFKKVQASGIFFTPFGIKKKYTD